MRQAGETRHGTDPCEREEEGGLPGEGVGVGAVEVPELLDLADELPQRGHLPHVPAAAGAAKRRRRPPARPVSSLGRLSCGGGRVPDFLFPRA
jgi:hypothetical protein